MSTNTRPSKRISYALSQPRSNKGSKLFINGNSLKEIDRTGDKETYYFFNQMQKDKTIS